MFPTPQQRAKQLDVMTAEERLRAIKHWYTPKIARGNSASFYIVPAGGSIATEDEEALSV